MTDLTRHSLTYGLFAMLAVSSTGCVSVWHFEDLEARVVQVETSVTGMKERQQQDQERLQSLYTSMTEAEETLRRSGANLGDDMESLKQDMARLQSSDEELTFSISKTTAEIAAIRRALQERLDISQLDLPEGLVQDPERLMAAASEAFTNGEDARAAELAGIAISKYPGSLTAAKALFLRGEIAFKAGNYASAVVEFQRVYSEYKSVSGAPTFAALLKIGEALERQDKCRKAIEIYEFLVDEDRTSSEARTAAERIKTLKRTCR